MVPGTAKGRCGVPMDRRRGLPSVWGYCLIAGGEPTPASRLTTTLRLFRARRCPPFWLPPYTPRTGAIERDAARACSPKIPCWTSVKCRRSISLRDILAEAWCLTRDPGVKLGFRVLWIAAGYLLAGTGTTTGGVGTTTVFGSPALHLATHW